MRERMRKSKIFLSSKGSEKKWGMSQKFKEIMAKNFLGLKKKVNSQNQGAQKKPTIDK